MAFVTKNIGCIQIGKNEGRGYNYVSLHTFQCAFRSKAEVRKLAKDLEEAAKYMRKLVRSGGELE